MRTLGAPALALVALCSLAGCFVGPAERGTSSTGSSATTAATGGSSTSGTGSTSGSTTGGCQADADCHKSNPDECNTCNDMRLICDQGACVCACQASSGSTGTSGTTGSTGTTSTSGSSGTTGGRSCFTDADCPPVSGVSQYCEIGLVTCSSGDVTTPTPGFCHRDCEDGTCTCQSDLDCPVFGCDPTRGACNPGGVVCSAPQPCPSGCSATGFAEEPCPVCVCGSCPVPDAGGDPCGGCGNGSVCCGAQGGTWSPDAGGGISYACHALEVDGGCPPGAICAISSSGDLESCNFYYP